MSERKLFSFDKILENTGGDSEIANQVIDLQLSLYEDEMSKLKTAVEQSHFEEVRKLAHKSKSGFMILGADQAYQLAVELEDGAKSQDQVGMQESFLKFEALSQLLMEQLRASSISNQNSA